MNATKKTSSGTRSRASSPCAEGDGEQERKGNGRLGALRATRSGLDQLPVVQRSWALALLRAAIVYCPLTRRRTRRLPERGHAQSRSHRRPLCGSRGDTRRVCVILRGSQQRRPLRVARARAGSSQIHPHFGELDRASSAQIIAKMGRSMLALNAGAYGARVRPPQGLARQAGPTRSCSATAQISTWRAGHVYVRPFPEEAGAHWESTLHTTRPHAADARIRCGQEGARAHGLVRGAARRRRSMTARQSSACRDRRDLGGDLPAPHGEPRRGSPRRARNAAQACYRATPHVDVIGDDLYDIRGHGATWAAAAEASARRIVEAVARSPSGDCGASTDPVRPRHGEVAAVSGASSSASLARQARSRIWRRSRRRARRTAVRRSAPLGDHLGAVLRRARFRAPETGVDVVQPAVAQGARQVVS